MPISKSLNFKIQVFWNNSDKQKSKTSPKERLKTFLGEDYNSGKISRLKKERIGVIFQQIPCKWALICITNKNLKQPQNEDLEHFLEMVWHFKEEKLCKIHDTENLKVYVKMD